MVCSIYKICHCYIESPLTTFWTAISIRWFSSTFSKTKSLISNVSKNSFKANCFDVVNLLRHGFYYKGYLLLNNNNLAVVNPTIVFLYSSKTKLKLQLLTNFLAKILHPTYKFWSRSGKTLEALCCCSFHVTKTFSDFSYKMSPTCGYTILRSLTNAIRCIF